MPLDIVKYLGFNETMKTMRQRSNETMKITKPSRYPKIKVIRQSYKSRSFFCNPGQAVRTAAAVSSPSSSMLIWRMSILRILPVAVIGNSSVILT